jgi:hypothetical protein
MRVGTRAVGMRVGTLEGMRVGTLAVGRRVGIRAVGRRVGTRAVGVRVGTLVGMRVGTPVVGRRVGGRLGNPVGARVEVTEGLRDGRRVGNPEGGRPTEVGSKLGVNIAADEGDRVGTNDGEFV